MTQNRSMETWDDQEINIIIFVFLSNFIADYLLYVDLCVCVERGVDPT